MRAKVVIAIAGLGILVFGALYALHQNEGRTTNISNPPPGKTATAAKVEPIEDPVAQAGNAIKSETQAPPSSEGGHNAYVEQRSSQLMDLAMNDDRASLDSILSELTNRDPEIRKAALEATIQFGSRDAIPKLADAASQTDDPNEKTALNDAIEFLKLPSLTEITAAHAAKPEGQTVAKTTHKGGLARPVPAVPQPNQ